MKKVWALAGLVALILESGGAASGAPLSAPRPLSRVQRAQIVTAAQRAIHRFVHLGAEERRGGRIPRRLWGAAIERLRPVRVVDDRVNVMIVLGEDAGQEHGLYVSVPVSSYAPGHDGRFAVFEKLSRPGDKVLGMLYRYRLRKAEPDAPPGETPRPPAAGEGGPDRGQSRRGALPAAGGVRRQTSDTAVASIRRLTPDTKSGSRNLLEV